MLFKKHLTSEQANSFHAESLSGPLVIFLVFNKLCIAMGWEVKNRENFRILHYAL